MKKQGLLFFTLMMGLIIACSSLPARLVCFGCQSSQSFSFMPDRIESRQELPSSSGSAVFCVPALDGIEMIRVSSCKPARKKVNPSLNRHGKASWYGKDFQGKEVASSRHHQKKYFNMWEMTAASKSFPLGKKVQVTNVKSGQSVIVTITDRGPKDPGRLIDLSYGAFVKIGDQRDGLLEVKVALL